MEKEMLKMLVNKYMIQIKVKDGAEYLWSPFREINKEMMETLKESKSQIIAYIKDRQKIDETIARISWLAHFLTALENVMAKHPMDIFDTDEDGNEDDEVSEMLKTIERHKKVYPEESAKAEVYKYIMDTALYMSKRYQDLYFSAIGDKYIDALAIAPVDSLDSVKTEFDAEMRDYYKFKHDEYPDV